MTRHRDLRRRDVDVGRRMRKPPKRGTLGYEGPDCEKPRTRSGGPGSQGEIGASGVVREASRETAGTATGKGRAAPGLSKTKVRFWPFLMSFFSLYLVQSVVWNPSCD